VSQRLKVPALAFLVALALAACGGDAESASDLDSERLDPVAETAVEETEAGEVEADEAPRGEVRTPDAAAPPARQETAPPPPAHSPAAGAAAPPEAQPPAQSPAAGGAAPPEAQLQPEQATEPETLAPEVEPVAIPAGARIVGVLEHSISTRSHEAGDRFEARVVEEVLAADGMVLVPEGARLVGRVVEAEASRDSDRDAVLVLAFESLVMNGQTFPMNSTVVEVEMAADAGDSGTRSAAKVATGAAAGAVIGQILGRDTRSTVRGAAAGAVAGAGVAVTTRDGHAQIQEGARLVVQVDQPVILASGR